jgi:hypothetical protein
MFSQVVNGNRTQVASWLDVEKLKTCGEDNPIMRCSVIISVTGLKLIARGDEA